MGYCNHHLWCCVGFCPINSMILDPNLATCQLAGFQTLQWSNMSICKLNDFRYHFPFIKLVWSMSWHLIHSGGCDRSGGNLPWRDARTLVVSHGRFIHHQKWIIPLFFERLCREIIISKHKGVWHCSDGKIPSCVKRCHKMSKEQPCMILTVLAPQHSEDYLSPFQRRIWVYCNLSQTSSNHGTVLPCAPTERTGPEW